MCRIVFGLFLFLPGVLYPAVSFQNSALNFPYSGAYINTSMPTFTGILRDASGVHVQNETVQIIVDAGTIGTTQTQSTGVFMYNVPTEYALTDGVHSIECSTSEITLGPVSFTIDTSIPPAPVLTAPSSGGTVGNPVVITGTTTYPYASVFVFLDGTVYADVVCADAQGNWTTEYTLPAGAHAVQAQVQSLAGNQGDLCASLPFLVS